jgi:hypothetical protein
MVESTEPQTSLANPSDARRLDLLCRSQTLRSLVGRAMNCINVHRITAIAAATGTAKTPKAVECEASQSGPKGIAHA